MNIGIIGCGKIAPIYVKTLAQMPDTRVKACADRDASRARSLAAEYGLPACTPEQIMTDPDIGLVLNLTVPRAHAEVALAAVDHGKHVYNEKPLAVKREDAQLLLRRAEGEKVLVGCAPDTVLGAGIQTCRKLLDEGAIGTPMLATAFMAGCGPERWHPDPDFFYQPGGGPLFDMGPYYLTALVTLLGAISSVTAAARISAPERIIGSGPRAGSRIAVTTETTVAGNLEFATGALGTLLTTFDVIGGHHLPRIEIHGSEGSLSLPDPNCFGGPVMLLERSRKDWREVPLSHPYDKNSRGLGVQEMVAAAARSRSPRASGKLAYHVLDTMHCMLEAGRSGQRRVIDSNCERPEPMPALNSGPAK